MPERRRLLIVVGPTAGHVYPALALADAWRALDPRVELRFAGALDGPAERLLAARGFRLEPISGSQLVNVGLRGKLAAVPRVLAGMAQARRVLRAHGTRLVLGLGGYTSGAVQMVTIPGAVKAVVQSPDSSSMYVATNQGLYFGTEGNFLQIRGGDTMGVAAAMVGMESRNENSSAAARDMPAVWPAAIVAIERDVPGKTAERIWHAPIQIAWPSVACCTLSMVPWLFREPTRSTCFWK